MGPGLESDQNMTQDPSPSVKMVESRIKDTMSWSSALRSWLVGKTGPEHVGPDP